MTDKTPFCDKCDSKGVRHKKACPNTKPKTDVQQKIVEVVKEILVERVVEVPEPRLEGFELYKALKDKGFFQGGMGQFMEDPNGVEKVYIPTHGELQTYFIGDPQTWDKMRDAMIRAYIELQ